jgi:acetylornithine/succinyldiaminopimelate/putrescine aminotransferase
MHEPEMLICQGPRTHKAEVGADLRTSAIRRSGASRPRSRRRGVLVCTTGPDGSVLKIRPPLVISSSETGTLVGMLDEALRAISDKDPRRDTRSRST